MRQMHGQRLSAARAETAPPPPEPRTQRRERQPCARRPAPTCALGSDGQAGSCLSGSWRVGDRPAILLRLLLGRPHVIAGRAAA